jgi:putative addiction module killer protein
MAESIVLKVLRTPVFEDWFAAMKDERGQARIAARLVALSQGHFGDCEAVGGGVSELRIDFGPGYRVYFARKGKLVYVLLVGGDKKSQKLDIKRARKVLEQLT